MAEVVKTGLLMGEPVWELPLAERVRRCAASRPASASPTRTTAARGTSSTSVTRSGTRSRRRPATTLPHGQAVALGMVAALQLSGNEDALAAVRSSSTRSRSASTARPPGRHSRGTRRRVDGTPRLVLLARFGEPTWGNELPAADVRAALDGLIAD